MSYLSGEQSRLVGRRRNQLEREEEALLELREDRESSELDEAAN